MMEIPFGKISGLIRRYNSGYNLKEEDLLKLLEWSEEFTAQLRIEKKALTHKNKSWIKL